MLLQASAVGYCGNIDKEVVEQDAPGPVNVCAPQPVQFAAFASAVGRTLRRPSLLRVPPWVLRLGMGEMAEIVLHGQRALPVRLTDAGFEFRHPSVEGALGALLRK